MKPNRKSLWKEIFADIGLILYYVGKIIVALASIVLALCGIAMLILAIWAWFTHAYSMWHCMELSMYGFILCIGCEVGDLYDKYR